MCSDAERSSSRESQAVLSWPYERCAYMIIYIIRPPGEQRSALFTDVVLDSSASENTQIGQCGRQARTTPTPILVHVLKFSNEELPDLSKYYSF